MNTLEKNMKTTLSIDLQLFDHGATPTTFMDSQVQSGSIIGPEYENLYESAATATLAHT
jgi:hypothetical protein